MSCIAGELFDSPGPGYRQQIERVFPTPGMDPINVRIGTPIIYVAPSLLLQQPFPAAQPFDSTSAPPDRLRSFSEPIRLTIDQAEQRLKRWSQ